MAAVTRALTRLESAIVPSLPKRIQLLWYHDAGLKTVHFWAPAFKWGLVIAGLADAVTRPPENLSVGQCSSLAATGVIWSRYSLVIIPKNYTLLSVNMFVALTNFYQLGRIWNHNKSQNQTPKGQ
ncbi:uncharacterized protein [Dysidea avara]|uniref:uncharacterized protein n=1 Tax=Dysidea avara TaxID=196820 RepID=UPI003331AC8E